MPSDFLVMIRLVNHHRIPAFSVASVWVRAMARMVDLLTASVLAPLARFCPTCVPKARTPSRMRE